MHLESSYIRRFWYHCKHYLQDLETFSHWFCIIFKAEFKWIRIPESILLIKMLCSSCRTETLLNSKTTSLLTQKTSAVIHCSDWKSISLPYPLFMRLQIIQMGILKVPFIGREGTGFPKNVILHLSIKVGDSTQFQNCYQGFRLPTHPAANTFRLFIWVKKLI
jgi:hypothetical protein